MSIKQEAEALILHKRSISLPQLAGMSIDDLRQLQRAAYLQAQEKGVVSFLIQLAMTLGSLDGTRHAFSYTAGEMVIRIIYTAGTLLVTAGGQTVCSNLTAGGELLIPGQWLAELVNLWESKEREAAWKIQIATERTKAEQLNAWNSVS